MKIDEIESNSEQLREILEKPNSAFLSWGITVIFGIITAIFLLLWLIKYPDVIAGNIELTTTNPPIKLVNKNDAEIKKIYFENNDLVKKGDLILESKNTISAGSRKELQNVITEIREHLNNASLKDFQIPRFDQNFGAIQENYGALITSIISYQNLSEAGNIPFRIRNLNDQLRNTNLMNNVANEQIVIAQNRLKRMDESLEADRTLYSKGIISKTELNQKENDYDVLQNELKNLRKDRIQNDLRLTELRKEINDAELEYKVEGKMLLGQINEQLTALQYDLDNWEMNNLITAPFDGKLTFLGNIKPNQFIQGGRDIFTVVPNTQEYIALMKIPKLGYGKVRKNQTVRIKLDNFPHFEFGLLNGKVQEVSLIPNEDMYLVKVKLTNGLRSSYNKDLKFTPEMSGTAEIITEELRLIDRIFSRIRDIFS